MTRGRFITLEGIEGAGKTTVAQLLRDWLHRRGVNTCLTREPGGTALAERVRQIVLERGPEQVSAVTETLLMFAARRIHLDNLVRPALGRGEWVICDRFTDATRAYQGYGRGMDREWIESLAQAVHGDLQPDCTLLLDVPVSVGLGRARARSGHSADRFESEREAFFERVRHGYLQIAAHEVTRVQVIDAGAELSRVRDQVIAVLEQRYGSVLVT